MTGARPRSCPACRSIGPPKGGCQNLWHAEVRPSHTAVSSPTARPADPLIRELADGLRRIEYRYAREGSGPGSRFESQLLEDAQAAWLVRELLARELSPHGLPLPLMPPRMRVDGRQVWLTCEDHGHVLQLTTVTSLRTLSFEARRHWREQHS